MLSSSIFTVCGASLHLQVRDRPLNACCAVVRYCYASNLVDTLSARSELSLHYLLPHVLWYVPGVSWSVGWLAGWVAFGTQRTRLPTETPKFGCLTLYFKSVFQCAYQLVFGVLGSAIIWSRAYTRIVATQHCQFTGVLCGTSLLYAICIILLLCWSRRIFISGYAY
jgi:hypothetical protein